MAQPYIATICAFGCNFPPRSWAFCNGQIIGIAQNTALFSILGTTYGGNGQTTFGLPNLMARVPMHWGTPPGLPATVIGEIQGSETVTLNVTQIPQHTHQAYAAVQGSATERTAAPNSNGTSFLSNSAPSQTYQSAPTVNAPFSPQAMTSAGNSIAHENLQPYLVLNFCIAQFGAFPSRN